MLYKKQCPVCKSSYIVLYSGGVTGAYECKKCGYVGTVIMEVADKVRKSKKRSK